MKPRRKFYCVRRRKNAFLIRVGVEIVWDNVHSMDGWILGRTSGIPRRFFAGEDDITKEREPGSEIIERTPVHYHYFSSNFFLSSATLKKKVTFARYGDKFVIE